MTKPYAAQVAGARKLDDLAAVRQRADDVRDGLAAGRL